MYVCLLCTKAEPPTLRKAYTHSRPPKTMLPEGLPRMVGWLQQRQRAWLKSTQRCQRGSTNYLAHLVLVLGTMLSVGIAGRLVYLVLRLIAKEITKHQQNANCPLIIAVVWGMGKVRRRGAIVRARQWSSMTFFGRVITSLTLHASVERRNHHAQACDLVVPRQVRAIEWGGVQGETEVLSDRSPSTCVGEAGPVLPRLWNACSSRPS